MVVALGRAIVFTAQYTVGRTVQIHSANNQHSKWHSFTESIYRWRIHREYPQGISIGNVHMEYETTSKLVISGSVDSGGAVEEISEFPQTSPSKDHSRSSESKSSSFKVPPQKSVEAVQAVDVLAHCQSRSESVSVMFSAKTVVFGQKEQSMEQTASSEMASEMGSEGQYNAVLLQSASSPLHQTDTVSMASAPRMVLLVHFRPLLQSTMMAVDSSVHSMVES